MVKVPMIGLIWGKRLQAIAERYLLRGRVVGVYVNPEDNHLPMEEQRVTVELPCGQAPATKIINEFTSTTNYLTS